MSDFQKALDNLPDDTDLDVHHNTVKDLCWLCLHEIDLHQEGEYRHSIKRLKEYRAFINKFGDDWFKGEVNKIWAKALAQNEFYGE